MIQEISIATGIPAAELYGIATFYSQFHLEPRGKNLVRVCHGTACHLAGADKVSYAVEMATGAKEGGTSPDGQFSVERVACLGCCSLAPVMMVNEDVHAHVKVDKIASLLKRYKEASQNTEDQKAVIDYSEAKGHATSGEPGGE